MPESDWKGDFRVSIKSFCELLMYKIAPMSQKKQNRLRSPMSVNVPVTKAHRKTVNVFGIYRASISAIIKKVSYAIATFSEAKPTKLPTTEKK